MLSKEHQERIENSVNSEIVEPEQNQMILTTQDTNNINLQLAGTGKMSINWGDGTIKTFALLSFDGDWWNEDKALKYILCSVIYYIIEELKLKIQQTI